jgi:hypothetical protein
MLNLIVKGAGNWLLQNTGVTRKTTWCCHRCDTHCSELQISLHAVYTSVMSLSVRKCNISAGKVTLLSLSPCKHWMRDGDVPKVPMQFSFVRSVQWGCSESCKARGFEGKRMWLVGRACTTTDLNTFDSYLLEGCDSYSMWSVWFVFAGGQGSDRYVNNPYA